MIPPPPSFPTTQSAPIPDVAVLGSAPTDGAILEHNVDLLTRLKHNPEDPELLQEIAEELYAHPEHFAAAANQVSPQKSAKRKAPTDRDEYTWSNVTKNEVCHPYKILYPTSLQDILNAVNEAREAKKTLRAVGSGHSFSDVALTDGILLNPRGMNAVLPLDATLLKDPSAAATLFAVQSGIAIHDLNNALDVKKLALINMGAYDGQTLAGAISTGTHGTGAGLGPLSNAIASLVLVSETGVVYQIEPTEGITDPAKFNAQKTNVVLKQDDDWFYSNLVAMGCMGVIYSYTLNVMPAYYLQETRLETTWETIRSTLLPPSPGTLAPAVTASRHFEIDVNPYATDQKGVEAHVCIVSTREIVDGPASGSRGFANWLSGFLAEYPGVSSALAETLNWAPKLAPWIVKSALSTLTDNNYTNKSFKVLDLGNVNKVSAYAIELSFDAPDFVHSIDTLLNLFAQAAEQHDWYQPGPIGIRFVASAGAYLAPQYGRVSCMAECDMLNGIKTGQKLLRFIEKGMWDQAGVRVHWGMDLDELRAEQVQRMYEKYPKWLTVYHALNSTGIFNNAFTDRLGISISA